MNKGLSSGCWAGQMRNRPERLKNERRRSQRGTPGMPLSFVPAFLLQPPGGSGSCTLQGRIPGRGGAGGGSSRAAALGLSCSPRPRGGDAGAAASLLRQDRAAAFGTARSPSPASGAASTGRGEIRRMVSCSSTSKQGKEGTCILMVLGLFYLQSEFDSSFVENHLCLLKKWYRVIVAQNILFFLLLFFSFSFFSKLRREWAWGCLCQPTWVGFVLNWQLSETAGGCGMPWLPCVSASQIFWLGCLKKALIDTSPLAVNYLNIAANPFHAERTDCQTEL